MIRIAEKLATEEYEEHREKSVKANILDPVIVFCYNVSVL